MKTGWTKEVAKDVKEWNKPDNSLAINGELYTAIVKTVEQGNLREVLEACLSGLSSKADFEGVKFNKSTCAKFKAIVALQKKLKTL